MKQYFKRSLKWFQPKGKRLFGILVRGYSSYRRNKNCAGKHRLVEFALGVYTAYMSTAFWEGGALAPEHGGS